MEDTVPVLGLMLPIKQMETGSMRRRNRIAVSINCESFIALDSETQSYFYGPSTRNFNGIGVFAKSNVTVLWKTGNGIGCDIIYSSVDSIGYDLLTAN
ncbi:Hypothetical predicted protein [Octopus vulgaris]|uniref:Uncharacterized protein n=1 Tax=Octopus vulgaris TaxID=6645 RepID=A0AA36BB97_OCTVU|nr:Hypothetical predicted protein [Octopus vulgaris]